MQADINNLYNDRAFEQLFKEQFKALHAYSYSMLRDEDAAEEIVQNMFMKLWEKRELLTIQTSVKAYLYRCVHNDSLNVIKHEKTKINYQNSAMYVMQDKFEKATEKLELKELEERISQALNDLPQQCRTIFQMSRFEELKYKEIADKLGLSIKTVENQMGKALKIMRLKLVDFLPIILLFLFKFLIGKP